MIWSGFKLSAEQREAIAKILGKELNPEIWEYEITGHRMLVCPEPSNRTYKGTIFLPNSAVERSRLEMGAGWIISVGPAAGSSEDLVPHPGGLLCSASPSELLGIHILYRSHTGITIKTGDDDQEFMADLIVLTDRDVLAWSKGL